MRQKDDVHFSDAGGARAAWVIIDQLKTLIDLSASKVPQDPPSQSAPDRHPAAGHDPRDHARGALIRPPAPCLTGQAGIWLASAWAMRWARWA